MARSPRSGRTLGERLEGFEVVEIFRFEGAKGPVYWIYAYKRGAFYPFVPKGSGQERDNATELELKAKLERELPIEPDLSRWYGMFDAPV